MKKLAAVTVISGLLLAIFVAPAARAEVAGSGPCAVTVTTAASVVVVKSGSTCYVAFTGTGSNAFTVPAGVTTADLLIIAGGGAGGNYAFAGGGGAGEVAVATGYSLTPSTSVSVSVGAGGTGDGSSTNAISTSGSNSWVGSSTGVVANGGGAGNSFSQNTVSSGGSGGGGGEKTAGSAGGASVKSTYGTATRYGNAGGSIAAAVGQTGSGGGGAGGAGGAVTTAYSPSLGGSGTNAVSTWLSAISSAMTSITGWVAATSGGYIAGGGGGGSANGIGASGGAGGGGSGGTTPGSGVAGVSNTGSGGGGTTYSGPASPGGAGGSGLIVVKFGVAPSATSITISVPTINTYRTTSTITATLGVAGSDGKVTFYQNGKKIAGCINVVSASLVATCSWRPSTRGSQGLYAVLTPSTAGYLSSVSATVQSSIKTRTSNR